MVQPKIGEEDIKLFEKLYAEKHNRLSSKDAEGKYSCVMMQTAFEFWCIAWASQQAKIDELMLEYCQDEMTTEQLEIYAQSQKVSQDTSAIDKLFADKNPATKISY